MIDDLCRFLQGDTESVVDALRARDDARFRGDWQYERAAALRDQLHAIEQVVEGQKIVSQDGWTRT